MISNESILSSLCFVLSQALDSISVGVSSLECCLVNPACNAQTEASALCRFQPTSSTQIKPKLAQAHHGVGYRITKILLYPLHSRLRQDHRSPQNKWGVETHVSSSCSSQQKPTYSKLFGCHLLRCFAPASVATVFCAEIHSLRIQELSVCFLRTCHPSWPLVIAVFVIFTHSYHS